MCVAGRGDGSNSTGVRDGSVKLGPAVFEASSHGAFWLMAQRMGLSKLLVGGMKMNTQVTVARRQIKTYEGGSWKARGSLQPFGSGLGCSRPAALCGSPVSGILGDVVQEGELL